MTVRRVEALEAGMHFMTWVFSDGHVFAEDVRGFTARIGMRWSDVEAARNDAGLVTLVEGIGQASAAVGPQVSAWFEVGRNTIFLSNMIGTVPPTPFIDAALSGYRGYLEDAQVRIEERDRLEGFLREMKNASLEEKSAALGRLRENLRDLAQKQDDQVEAATTPVVLLVHGIRDFALWQNSIRHTLEENGFVTEPLNYGRFNLLKFLTPIPIFRRQAINEIGRQVDIVVQNNPDAPIHVIAHSFGTYIVSHLMRERFNLRFNHVIFCGSVVPFDFDFEQIQDRFARPIVNEVGTRDIWPALAESVTTGYGSAGTYGFRRPLVRDRWHNGAKHGYFLDRKFCTEFWIPFLRDGEIIKGESQPESTPIWLNLVHIFKIKYAIPTLVFAVLMLSLPFPFDPLCGATKTATIRENIAQLQRQLSWMGSSEGYSAGNREQWLALLDGFNAAGDEVFATAIAELRTIVMGAPANDEDSNYNMFVSSEMSVKLQDLRTRIEKAAALCSIPLS